MSIDVQALFSHFEKQQILVVGDVMIDAYMRGSVNRISPEAPVPIVNLKHSEDRLGGAANVAMNISSMGAKPILCSVIGDDSGGKKFFQLLDMFGLSSEGIVKSNERMTTTKTRVIGNNQQLLRIDHEELSEINKNEESLLLAKIESLLDSGIDAIILEDYNKGLLTENVITGIIERANERSIPVTADPKKENFFAYRNVTLFKPNLKELREGTGVDIDLKKGKEAFETAVALMEERLNNDITLVTLSEHGVFAKRGNQKDYIPAHIRTIADVSGAGDTVIAVATLCLVAGLSPAELAEVANISGGLVCEVSGVVPIDRELLKAEVLKLITA